MSHPNSIVTVPDYKPRFPEGYNPGIGIIGCGAIVRNAHMPAYVKHNRNVIGGYNPTPAAAEALIELGAKRTFRSVEELLADPQVEIVDIGTHPQHRLPLIRKCLASGKHVLAQKPLALDLKGASEVVAEAERRGLKLAVNQNGRWAPAWRIATLLVQQGAIGDVLAVTHLYDMTFRWVTGTKFDDVPHFALYDYSVHWVDISRCWLEKKTPSEVRAREYRTPDQPAESKQPWGMWLDVAYADGASAMIRGVACSSTAHRGHGFWVHGTHGTIRGSVLGEDFVELERAGVRSRFTLEGQWFNDGFAGTMGELQCAIVEKREPSNSARHNLLSLQMTLAACESAERDGAAVELRALTAW
jgi:predicted dehydrogenase